MIVVNEKLIFDKKIAKQMIQNQLGLKVGCVFKRRMNQLDKSKKKIIRINITNVSRDELNEINTKLKELNYNIKINGKINEKIKKVQTPEIQFNNLTESDQVNVERLVRNYFNMEGINISYDLKFKKIIEDNL